MTKTKTVSIRFSVEELELIGRAMGAQQAYANKFTLAGFPAHEWTLSEFIRAFIIQKLEADERA